jgi:O-methyltransferase
MTATDATAIVDLVLPYTMTDPTRVLGLIAEVDRVVQEGVSGDMVECGVWRGGSMMAVAFTLLRAGISNRNLYLFDTYQGMSAPEAIDVDYLGRPALNPSTGSYDATGCTVGLAEVQAAMRSTGYPSERIHYVVGMVEDTLPAQAPPQIAFLHLDTDWYRSTKHELEHLFPRISLGGCVMLDDYGHWKGCRKATDEYIAKHAPGGLTPVPCGYTAVVIRKP